MAQKDIEKKSLEELNDVFADIINVLLFKGRRIMSEDELLETNPRSNYSAQGKRREQERDVAKIWKQHEVRIAMIGLENQTREDEDMVLRMIGYDGAAYRNQMKRRDTVNSRQRYPVISLVLYFGTKHRWSKAKSLYAYFDIADDLKPYVSNYRMNVFNIAFLTDAQLAMFQSDFGIVADYFVQKRKNKAYKPPQKTVQHVTEMFSLMSALTGDYRFEEMQEELKGKERVNMCEVIDYYINLGEERGIQIGMQQGMQQKGDDDISKMAAYFRSQDASLTEAKAREMAENILR